ncbi:hypothetical protein DPMN_133390 [Dreissena polymorpha]|uniref:Uncharacterized protein n=1 Tax=Dreissena polymorpha TaxID=45954 RepID=A0A9D4FWX0_DREPO|nr:hypothetical protein DPMN_133390 [Dreissena polymorpha]
MTKIRQCDSAIVRWRQCDNSMMTVRQYDGDSEIVRWRQFDNTMTTVRYRDSTGKLQSAVTANCMCYVLIWIQKLVVTYTLYLYFVGNQYILCAKPLHEATCNFLRNKAFD